MESSGLSELRILSQYFQHTCLCYRLRSEAVAMEPESVWTRLNSTGVLILTHDDLSACISDFVVLVMSAKCERIKPTCVKENVYGLDEGGGRYDPTIIVECNTKPHQKWRTII